MPVHAIHKGARAAGIVKVIHLAFHGVQFLPQSLNLIPGVSLRGLHLPQLHIVLLHLLFKAEAAPAGAAARYAGAQRQSSASQRDKAQCTECAHNILFFKFALFPELFYAL